MSTLVHRLTVRAHLSLLAEGGRDTPIRTHYRPNHNFDGPESNTTQLGQVELDDGTEIAPGGSADVTVLFVLTPEYARMVRPGFRWRVQEATRLVGHGEIAEVLADTEDRM